MSSPCRTTFLLVSKESDGRISYKFREKEDALSLKMGEQTFCISFSFLHLHVFLSFVLFLPFLLFFSFSLFSFLIFLSFYPHFLFSFGHFLSLFGATTHSVKMRKFPPHFLKPYWWPSFFHLYSLFLYFFFMTSSTIWLNMGHGIPSPTHGSL